MSQFPEIIFGTCQRCGGRGGDYPASELTPADSTSDIDEAGNGLILEWFRGELMCELCKKEYKADEESEDVADRIADEELFRATAGFRKTIE